MIINVKTKIIFGFGIALALITVASVLSYQSFTRFHSAIDSVSKPDVKVEKMRILLSEISEAESGIRAYSLSKNEDYLSPYYHFLTSYTSEIASLKEMAESTPSTQREITVLDSLISEKLDRLFDFLDLKQSKQIQVRLGDIAQKLEEQVPKAETSREPVSEKSFLSRVKHFFGSKPPEEKKKENYGKKEIRKMLLKGEDENKVHELVLSSRELELLKKDDNVMIRLRSFVNGIEKEDRAQMARNLKEARAEVGKASQTLFRTGVLAMIALLVCVYFIFTDLSRSNRYKTALEASKRNTEEMAKAKEEFLANMSHEIRTPLNAIIGFTNLTLQDKLEEKPRTYVEGVKQSSEHLLNVVNDILDFSKIEAGKLEIEQTAFKPESVIQQVVDTLKGEAERKQIKLISFQEIPQRDLVLIGDPFRIRQILLNLCSNAIKFTAKGQVRIYASLVNPEEEIPSLEIKVEDSGIGIAPEKLGNIFGKFSQADTSTTRKYGGTGLGLAICQRLVMLMHGTINVESKVGEGSVFTMTLPCKKGNVKDLVKKDPASHGREYPELKQRKIIIADDDAMNRLLLKTILIRYDVIVSEAQNGAEAMNLLQEKGTDLIIADINMPELNGVEMVQQIRQLKDSGKAKTPVIALTANIIREDLIKYREAGMNECVIKPFQEEELIEAIYRTLGISLHKEGKALSRESAQKNDPN